MANTAGGSNLLVDKGEKIGLGIGAVLGVLLLALGLMAAMDRPQDPKEFSEKLDAKAKDLNRVMSSPDAKIDPVPSDLKDVVAMKNIPLVPNKGDYFDPTPQPDQRRITPVILAVSEGYADIAVLKILANDFQMEKDNDGNIIKVRVGVVTAKDPEKKLEEGKVSEFVKGVKDKLKTRIPRAPKAGAGMAGMAGGMIGGPPGGMIGGPPGGMGGLAPGGMGGGFAGPPGGGRGGPPGGGEAGASGGYFTGFSADRNAGKREEVQYIEGESDEDIEAKLAGRRLAITIKPQKMVVLQAAFPYRAQLERFKTALRYSKIEDLYNRPDDMPVFNGVDVQRRIYNPKGELLQEWETIDLAANSQELRAVKLFYKEDSADLKRVMLHEDHMLVMPLPQEIAGKYPEMTLKSVKDAIAKLKAKDPKGTLPPPPKGRFLGTSNPFKREEAGTAAGLYNPGGEGGAGGAAMLPPPPPKGKGGENTQTVATPSTYDPPDYVFVRAYDTDIQDGRTYEYRLRVKVRNPNFGKKIDQVSKASDADNEELPPLEEHWYLFGQKVKVPQAGYYYVTDPSPPNAKVANQMRAPGDGQAILLFQRWFDQLNVSAQVREPVGDWVQSELMATRGQFVSGKAFAPLPFWSSVDNTFVLREVQGDKAQKGKEPRRGVVLDPMPARFLLTVDVTGGKARARVAPNPGQPTNRGGLVDDDAAAEVLFLGPEGLEVRSSARDKADPDRKEREKHFEKWVEDTKKGNPAAPPPKEKSGF